MLTASERLIKRKYEGEGWQMFKIAWPDFIAYKGGKIKMIEAKCLGDRLSKQQRDSFAILQAMGFEIEIGYMKSTINGQIHKKGFNKNDSFFTATNRSLKEWCLSPKKEEPLKLLIKEKKEEIEEILKMLPKSREDVGS